MPNGIKECFLKNPIKNFIIGTDTKNAQINAVVSRIYAFEVSVDFVFDIKLENSNILSALAPKIAGTAAKKENSVASVLFMPSSLAPKIVAPEREVPGIIASD